MSDQQINRQPPDRFDRLLGALAGLPDVLNTPPTTVRNITPIVGDAQTFIVQTYRQRESGDTVFLEHVDDRGSTRLVIPPAVTKIIARQRDALTVRARKKAAKAAAEDRAARGIRPAFLKKKTKLDESQNGRSRPRERGERIGAERHQQRT